MTPVWLKPAQWVALSPPLRGYDTNRSAPVLDLIIDQFMVMSAERYRSFTDPNTGRLKTFCNIYVSDLTDALGCPIPHWVREGKVKKELNANDTLDWLLGPGAQAGWRKTDEVAARLHSDAGRPSVAIWKNLPGRPGHIALLRPRRPGSSMEATYTTQAGAVNFGYGLLSVGFGTKPVQFFLHA